MKRIAQYLLAFCAKRIIKKFKPIIIGITGSVGKTTTKDCIAHILESEYSVLQTYKNANNEFGLPLSILELKASNTKSGWIDVIKQAFKKAYTLDTYYEVLVLEMGMSEPGNLAYLHTIVQPHIAIVTNVESVHMQYFKNQDELAYEKATIIRKLRSGGSAFVNYDNEYTRKMITMHPTSTKIYTFGFDKKADIYATEVKNTELGLKAVIHEGEKKYPIHAPHLLGKHCMYSLLVAWGVARRLNISEQDIMKGIKTFKGPEGRMNLVEGINHSWIIDSSYNAEPSSMRAALSTLKDIPQGERRIAILGDMLELGSQEKDLHQELGRFVSDLRLDLVCFVGPRMKYAYESFQKQPVTYTRSALYFENSEKAAENLPQKIKEGDLLLIKGSNGMKMDTILQVLSRKR